MTLIAAVAGVAGPHHVPQEEVSAAFARAISPDGEHDDVIRRIHSSAGVQTRALALPLAEYDPLLDFGAANDAYIREASALAGEATAKAMAAAGIAPTDVDLLVTASTTGVVVPSLDTVLALRLELRPDVKRIPAFGFGCVGGAAGIARVHDYLQGHPDAIAVLVSVELCSLTVQRNDVSMANIVASGLFGDGAAAVVMFGDARHRDVNSSTPRVIATQSRLYSDSSDVMGWRVSADGFRIVLSPGIPNLVESHLRTDITSFLAAHGKELEEIAFWVAHPGGPRVLEAIENALELHDGQLDVTWRSLAAHGNLSSASVLHVLADTIATHDRSAIPDDSFGVLFAMGPGFCAEFVLLQW